MPKPTFSTDIVTHPSGPVVKYIHLYREWITHMDGKAQSPVVVWKIYFH